MKMYLLNTTFGIIRNISLKICVNRLTVTSVVQCLRISHRNEPLSAVVGGKKYEIIHENGLPHVKIHLICFFILYIWNQKSSQANF